jgi:hypothetical protein
LWDGDPSAGSALVLGRFPPEQFEAALRLAEVWAPRYDVLTLGEAAPAAAIPRILAQWRDGERIAS